MSALFVGQERLELVSDLCTALALAGIRYCSWKSNDVLERALAGESDLDLLVRADDGDAFDGVLAGLGFRQVQPPRTRRVPDVVHAYAPDPSTGRMVHIHAHFRLVLGDDTTKNYRLPIEDAYLASARLREGIPVPSPELEYVVFVIRMVLKHCTWDAIVLGKRRLRAAEVRELVYLSERTDPIGATAFLRQELPIFDAALFERCLWSLRLESSRWFVAGTARRLERRLRPYARRKHADALVRLVRRLAVLVRRHVLRRRPPRGTLASGGAVIAVVGSDGSGKTTIVGELQRCFSDAVRTTTVHLGKPPPSLTSRAIAMVWRIAGGHVVRGPSVSGRDLAASDGRGMTLRAKLRLVRQVSTARDRWLAARGSRRLATRGAIVVADRFPLPEIEEMDGPLARRIASSPGAPSIMRRLALLERSYYRRIADPDIVVVLQVSPDVAVARRLGIDDPETVRRRSEAIRVIGWRHRSAVVIDADQPLVDVVTQARTAVWSRL